MLIPYQEISPEALYSLAKEWVISNMTEIESQPQIIEWTEQTIVKIQKGELVVEFGEESQSVYLKSKDDICFKDAQENS